MYLISHVCAEFHDRKGNLVYRMTPDMRNTIQDAPEAIREDLLFALLVQDGSIVVPENERERKRLEEDPLLGIGADGKAVRLQVGEAAAPAAGKAPAKKAAKPATKPAQKPETETGKKETAQEVILKQGEA